MSLTPNFPVLQNPSTNDGNPWHTVAEGDALTARNKGAVIIAKDGSGNLQMPLVDSTNRLVVNTEFEDIVDLRGEGDNAGSGTPVDLFNIVLQQNTDYQNLEWVVSCFRESTFEIIHIADVGGSPVETVLATPKVGAGSFTSSGKLKSRFTSGGVGVQHLVVRASNLTATSQLEATASIEEVQ